MDIEVIGLLVVIAVAVLGGIFKYVFDLMTHNSDTHARLHERIDETNGRVNDVEDELKEHLVRHDEREKTKRWD